jgi:hypothetical protein
MSKNFIGNPLSLRDISPEGEKNLGLSVGFNPPLGGLGGAQLVENKGVEPLTPCVQGRCSGQLS